MRLTPANKVDDPCQICRERHLKCDDNHPKCKQCERLREPCYRSTGKLKFRPGSSAKLDKTFKKDQPWLMRSRTTKVQFVDEGPGLENFYSHDDLNGYLDETKEGVENDPAPQRPGLLLKRTLTSSTATTTTPSWRYQTSPTNTENSLSDALVLSPSSTVDSQNPCSPLKRPYAGEDGYHQLTQRRLGCQRLNPYYDPVRPGSRSHPARRSSPDLYNESAADAYAMDPAKRVEAEYIRLVDTKAATIPPDELLEPAIWKEKFYWPNKYTTTQCACLLRYFIEVLGPWFDVGDPERRFTLEIPQRARRCPPLLNALFTLSARHLRSVPHYKTSDNKIRYQGINLPDLTENTHIKYHLATIAYLQKLARDAEHVRDENLLAAAVILRYYADLDTSIEGTDTELSRSAFTMYVTSQSEQSSCSAYIKPTTQRSDSYSSRPPSTPTNAYQPPPTILEHASTQLRSFQHACFRIALRQMTFSAYMEQQHISIPLAATWSLLDTFTDNNTTEDFIHSDRHLKHFAEVIQYCFPVPSSTHPSINSSPTISVQKWQELKSYHVRWEDTKPLTFSPIHHEHAPTPTPANANTFFIPKIWHMSDLHFHSLQFLDLARLLLAVYNPTLPRLGPGSMSATRHLNDEVCEIVVRLCGIAESNPACQPARIAAYMAIAKGGERFEREVERRTLEGVCEALERDGAWPTGTVREELRRAWRGLVRSQ